MNFTFEQLRQPIGKTVYVKFSENQSLIGTIVDTRIGRRFWLTRVEYKVRFKTSSDSELLFWAASPFCAPALHPQFLEFA